MKLFLTFIFTMLLVLTVQSQNPASPYEISVTVFHPKGSCLSNTQPNSGCWKAKKISDPDWTFEIEAIENFQPTVIGEYDLKLLLGSDDGVTTYELLEIIAVREQ